MSENARRRGRRTVIPERIISDRALAHRISGGDVAALDELFRRYNRQIYGFCSAMVGPEDAKDVLQNVMTKVMTSMPDNKDFQIRPWLFRVARNECIDLHRSSGRTRSGLEPDQKADESARTDPHRALVEKHRIRTLVEDLGQLPERQRSGLVMRELSGLSFTEIAESLGTSSDGAKQLVYEARLSLEQADLGRKLDCAEVREAISSLDGRRLKGKKVRAHLRSCEGCADFKGTIDTRRASFKSLFPGLPIPVAAGILESVREGATSTMLGGGVASASGSLAAGGAGVAAKALVAVAIIGGVGVGARDLVGPGKPQEPVAGVSGGPSTPEVPQSVRLGSAAPVAETVSEGRGDDDAGASGRPGKKTDETAQKGQGTGHAEGDIPEAGVTAPPASTIPVEQVDSITPGQGNGKRPADLPSQAATGQARAEAASSAKPGRTGNPPPGPAVTPSSGKPGSSVPSKPVTVPPTNVPEGPEKKSVVPSKPQK